MRARIWLSVLAGTLFLALSGCGDSGGANSLAQGSTALDKGDLKTASIHLKAALQENPESAQGRFLFGKLLLEMGNPSAAEIELRKAQDRKHPVDDVAPVLARCLFDQQKYQQVIADYANLELANSIRQAALSATVASAYAVTGQRDRAKAIVDAAVARSPNSAPILLVHAKLAAGQGDVDGALRIVTGVVEREPANLEAWRLRGDLLLNGKSDRPGALTAYKRALDVRSDDVSANTMVIGIHLMDKDMAAAKQQHAVMSKLQANHPMTGYLGANIAFISGDYARARDLLSLLLKMSSENVNVLLLAAATEMQLNSLGRAETHLNKALSMAPESPMTRRLLAKVHLRNGDPPKAMVALNPLLSAGVTDVEALTLAAEAHLQAGDAKKAEAFFVRVAQLRPNDAKARAAIAMVHFATGDTASSLLELESIAAGDSGTMVDLALINARLRLRDSDGALKAVDALAQKLPNRPLPADLRGRILMLKGDIPSAKASFEKALALDPVYFPSASMLAQLDNADGKPAAAMAHLEAILKVDPKHVRALVALAGLRSGLGSSAEEVGQLLSRAIDANPTEAATRVLLVNHWIKQGNPKLAVTTAQTGLATQPDEPTLLDSLGRAQLATDEVAQALNTFGKLAIRQPDSAAIQMRLAEANLRSGNVEAAERALRRALEIEPNLLAAQRGLVALAVRAKNPDKALQVAREVQRKRPNDALGHLLEGDAQAEFKNWDGATKAFRSALSKRGSAIAAVRLYTVLVTAKRKPEADRFADEWLRQHPKDTGLRAHLGNEAIAAGDLDLAERQLNEVVKLDPRNVSALNNLAWMQAKGNKPGAVANAERAVGLAPDNANSLDTLAFALSQAGQLERAVAIGKSAIRLAPDTPAIRLNLAKLYLKAKDPKNAKLELDILAKLGAKFDGYKEVVELQKGL